MPSIETSIMGKKNFNCDYFSALSFSSFNPFKHIYIYIYARVKIEIDASNNMPITYDKEVK